MKPQPQCLLAYITYQRGAGDELDGLLSAIASRLSKAGHTLAGSIKHSVPRPDRCRCDMLLENLHTKEFVPISQDRGPEARGCALDSSALESLVGSTMTGLEIGATCLIINRFGKLEAAGRGFRPAIEFAVCRQVPCLIGVEYGNLPAWRAFAGPLGEELPCQEDRVWEWCTGALLGRDTLPDSTLNKSEHQPHMH